MCQSCNNDDSVFSSFLFYDVHVLWGCSPHRTLLPKRSVSRILDIGILFICYSLRPVAPSCALDSFQFLYRNYNGHEEQNAVPRKQSTEISRPDNNNNPFRTTPSPSYLPLQTTPPSNPLHSSPHQKTLPSHSPPFTSPNPHPLAPPPSSPIFPSLPSSHLLPLPSSPPSSHSVHIPLILSLQGKGCLATYAHSSPALTSPAHDQ